jgi:hypothetical protein
MKKFKLLFNLILISASCLLLSCTPNSLASIPNNAPISIQGTITKIGNTPFEQIAVYIPKYNTSIPLTFKFQDHKTKAINNQGKKLKLKGLFQINTKKLANTTKEIKFYSLLVTSIN